MYIIRETFIAKPGHAGALAKLMKETSPDFAEAKSTVMLDFVTNYNTIVVETQVKSLAEFEKAMESYKKNKNTDMGKKMSGYTEMYYTGKREIFRIVD